ncbi:glycoside hydrolase domain-containing protein [Dyella sp. KRB-257]|uniref:glycoside hydrolase domain-containing protein n=1 Tax=Dyella sp. KRB-257 TaxID=3400915 RepID=UPI003C022D8F
MPSSPLAAAAAGTAAPSPPASDVYAIGRPFVAKAVLHLAGNKTFTITAAPFDALHPYVGEITLNGQPLEQPFVHHRDLVAGGELHFRMVAVPPGAATRGAPAR